MTIRIIDAYTNSFNIIGAKIILYSKYGSEEDYKIRGIFWVTSASRYQDIFTISASDSLIWFDNAIYDDDDKNTLAEVLYSDFVSARYSLRQCLDIICDKVKANLTEQNNVNFSSGIGDYFLWNNYAPIPDGYDVGGTYCVTEECAESLTTSSARDYLGYLAQIGVGFAYCRYYEETPLIYIRSFDDNYTTPKELLYKNCAIDSIERADFEVKCERVYVEVYSNETNSAKIDRDKNYNDNCYYTLDLTGNPFVDGNYGYTYKELDVGGGTGYTCKALLNAICKLLGSSYSYDKDDGNSIRSYYITVCPFKLTYYSEDRFYLGQSVMIPNSMGNNSHKSVLTKIQWNFRGGYNLECSGSDNRVLFDSARRTPSVRAKEQAIAKANYLANELNDELERQWNTFSADITSLSNGLTAQWNTLQSQIGDLSGSIGGVSGETSTLSERISNLESRVSALENAQN